jgi:hypothetical protein
MRQRKIECRQWAPKENDKGYRVECWRISLSSWRIQSQPQINRALVCKMLIWPCSLDGLPGLNWHWNHFSAAPSAFWGGSKVKICKPRASRITSVACHQERWSATTFFSPDTWKTQKSTPNTMITSTISSHKELKPGPPDRKLNK